MATSSVIDKQRLKQQQRVIYANQMAVSGQAETANDCYYEQIQNCSQQNSNSVYLKSCQPQAGKTFAAHRSFVENIDDNFDRRDQDNQDFSIVYLASPAPVGGRQQSPEQQQSQSRHRQRQHAASRTNKINHNKSSSGAPPSCSLQLDKENYSTSSAAGSLRSSSYCDSNSGSSGFSSSAEHQQRAVSRHLMNQKPPNQGQYIGSKSNGNGSPALGPTLKHLGLKSKVINDLDRLLAEASRCSENNSTSPTDSYFSSSSTLPRGQEFNYSTLCRDEFSSFIMTKDACCTTTGSDNNGAQIESPIHQRLNERAHNGTGNHAGPMLVGVHDGDNGTTIGNSHLVASESEEDSSLNVDDGEFEIQEIVSRSPSNCSPNCSINCLSEENQQLSSIGDRELVMINEVSERDRKSISIGSETGEEFARDDSPDRDERHQPLSSFIDVYLGRVENLLRLSKGDKNVSMGQFYHDEGANIEVSERFKTEIEFSPLKQNVSDRLKVVQEICMTIDGSEENCEINLYELNAKSKDFATILASIPQTSAILNWDATEQSKRCVKGLERAALERHIFKRFSLIPSDNLVTRPIQRHLSEFLESYQLYQRQLKEETSFCSDWHQNWLFAFKRPTETTDDEADSSRVTKRAKTLEGSSCSGAGDNPIDLIKYSTLILDKHKPVRLTYLQRQQQETVDKCYEAQEEARQELSNSSFDSRCQIDVCRMLLHDSEEDAASKNDSGSSGNKSLLVKYYNSNLVPCRRGNFNFVAHGHLFECPSIINLQDRRKARLLKERILLKLREKFLISSQERCMEFIGGNEQAYERERVRFSVSLTNVELVNKLPVIQFCARISGSLPIRVRWFRLERDGQVEISDSLGRENVRVLNHDGGLQADWPTEMEADFDYEYQNFKSKSWFRFKRCQNEIIFELRNANRELDYNQTYKCLIENYCSQDECCFALGERKVETIATSGSKKRAILRTWSQRTLHKPQPQELKPKVSKIERDQEDSHRNEERPSELASACGSTLKRLSLSSIVSDKDQGDKFGKNFPYHPENLLKRLEENKFSSLTFKTLRRVSNFTPKNDGGAGRQQTDDQFADTFLPLAVVADNQQQQQVDRDKFALQEGRPVPSAAAGKLSSQQVSNLCPLEQLSGRKSVVCRSDLERRCSFRWCSKSN